MIKQVCIISGLTFLIMLGLSVGNGLKSDDSLGKNTWPKDEGEHVFKISSEATESISLFGAYNNGRREENILIEKIGNKIRFRAWWMSSINSGGLWCIDCEIKEKDFQNIWKILEKNNVFELKNQSKAMSHAMTYWVSVKKGSKFNKAQAYGVGWTDSTTVFGGKSEVSEEWNKVVLNILNLRSKFVYAAQPAIFMENGLINWNYKLKENLLVEVLAGQKADRLKGNKLNENDGPLDWEEVLEIGKFKNKSIISQIAVLLDNSEPGISSAACAVMSWVSNLEFNSSPKYWKKWWKTASNSYVPIVSNIFENYSGDGKISLLGASESGFVGVEIEDNGKVWALVDIGGDWQGHTYQLYEFDNKENIFIKTEYARLYNSKGSQPPSPTFFRKIAKSGINFPIYNNGVWATNQNNWGAAILGQESIYHADAVAVIDFSNRKIETPLKTTFQYSGPIVSSDGNYVAVAKGWNWANPNDVVIINRKNGEERIVPVPAADSFGPTNYLELHKNGPGFILYRHPNQYSKPSGSRELWWASKDSSNATKLLEVPEEIDTQIRGKINITSNGSHLFVSRNSKNKKYGLEYGWFNILTKEFELIIPDFVYITNLDYTSDGNKVVFIHDSKVYLWSRVVTKK